MLKWEVGLEASKENLNEKNLNENLQKVMTTRRKKIKLKNYILVNQDTNPWKLWRKFLSGHSPLLDHTNIHIYVTIV